MRPASFICQSPRCGKEFTVKARAQGGGRRPKYCSPRCRSWDWIHQNYEKRQAQVTAYETSAKKKVNQFKARCTKYGLSTDEFTKQLLRQNSCCYGCFRTITQATARIDHDHKTGKFRGLLCDHCNHVLGLAKDDPTTLRRLMTYLDYQIDKTNIYLIGALKNKRIPIIGKQLRAEGFDVMDEWFTPGEEADLNWQAYEKLRGRSYDEALRGRAATNIILFDKSYIDHSDVVVLVAPAGKSAMLELGYAKGHNKPSIIFLDGQQPDRYDVMPGVADAVIDNYDDLVSALKKIGGR